MSIHTGQMAPNFTLYSSDKKEVSLSDYRGKNVVVLFFPLAFTSVCTAELCSVRDDIGSYNNVNAQVLGISVDTLFVLNKFKEEHNLNFTLLSDFNKTVSTEYGTLYDEFVFEMKGVSKRSAFVVDGNGVVQYAEILESAGDIPDFAKIRKTLDNLS